MSVLIKGMMMPINCQTCPFVQNEYPIGGEALVYRCRCTFTQKIADNPAFERDKDCPLVEIPPHGRLIDADALEEYCKRQVMDEWNQKAGTSWSYAFAEFEDIVYNRETIIDAEEVKE